MGNLLNVTIMSIFVLFSGFIIPVSNIPNGWRWFSFLSYMRYAFNMMLINEVEGKAFQCVNNLGGLPVLINPSNPACGANLDFQDTNCFKFYCPVTDGSQILNQLDIGVSNGAFWENFGLLLILYFAYRYLSYIIIVKYNPVKR